MTENEKPNSVCKWCQKPIEVCLGESPDSTGQCKGYVHVAPRTHFCPGHVAEPAEPSASSQHINNQMLDTSVVDRLDAALKQAKLSAEPTAEGPQMTQSQAVSAGTKRYWAKRKADSAAPQPVAGEGPRPWLENKVFDCLQAWKIFHPRTFWQMVDAVADLLEGKSMTEIRVGEYGNGTGTLSNISMQDFTAAPEGTPKLEEIARLQVEAILKAAQGPNTGSYQTDAEAWPSCGLDETQLHALLADILRPFITPACQKENLCGTANAPISMSADTHPIAETVERFEVRHLPDEEWDRLSVESREKISKWFNLATKYLQAILDEATPASTGEAADPFNPANLEANAGLAATLWRGFCEKTKVAEGKPDLDWWGFQWAAYAMAGLETLPRSAHVSTGEANGSDEHNCPSCGRWHSILKPPAPTSVPQAEPPK